MVDFALPAELELLRETTRGFARDHLAPRAREFERARAVPPEVRRVHREIGLHAVELPEAVGGAGLGPLAGAVVREELAAADAGAALALDPLGPALGVLAQLGGEPALRRWAAPCVASPEAGRLVLVCEADARLGAGGTLRGAAPWVPADAARAVVVLGAEGARVVDDGVVLEPVPGAGLRAAGAAAVRFDAAPVRAAWVDPAAAARALAHVRLYTTALLVGVLRASAEFSRAYALERHAFGRPIAHHQGLAFLIADMHTAVEGARLLLHEAAWHAEAGLPFEPLAAAAFVEAVEASTFVAPNGVQILGGHGFMADHPVEKWMREARALGLGCGGVDAAREDAGRALCAQPLPLALSPAEAG